MGLGSGLDLALALAPGRPLGRASEPGLWGWPLRLGAWAWTWPLGLRLDLGLGMNVV